MQKNKKIHNVRSDAGHIAMGAYCSAILSEDKRLVKRAKAIYEYKNIGASPILVTREANKSIQPTADASAEGQNKTPINQLYLQFIRDTPPAK